MGKKRVSGPTKSPNTKDRKAKDGTKKYFNPRVRAELWDVDYLEKLNPEEKAYYEKFMSEYANSNIKVNKDPLIEEYSKANGIGYKRSKKEMIGGGYVPTKHEGKPKPGHIHTKRSQAKESFDSNNRRNNDLFGVTKINNLLEYDLAGLSQREDIWHETDPESTENALIEMIDFKKDPEAAKSEYFKKKGS